MSRPVFDEIAEHAMRWLYQHFDRMRLSGELRTSELLRTSLGQEGARASCAHGLDLTVLPHRRSDALGWAQALKPLSELLVVCVPVLSTSDPTGDRHRLARHMVDAVWEDFGAGEVLHDLLRAEPGLTSLLPIYVLLRQTGKRHEGVERLAAHLATTRHWAAWEEPRYLALERLATQRALGLSTHADAEETIAGTWLGRFPEPWHLDYEHAYAVTHTVFYLTNWGLRPSHLPSALAGYLSDWLPCWSQVWCEEKDWDLLGELLAVDACLPQPALDERLWTHLAEAQLPDGSLPGLPPHFGSYDHQGEDAYLRDRHPTAVAALAATLASHRTTRA
ncbi:hypothetical protein GCM10022221_68770 [Actinocorallia aurea]